MSIKDVGRYLRCLFWGAVVSWIDNTRYKASLIIYLLDVLLSGLAFALLGKSIVYQKGISVYGTDNPVAFIVSGLVITHLINPVYERASWNARGIYNAMKSPVPLWLGIMQNIVMGYIWSIVTMSINIAILFLFGIVFNANIVSILLLLPLSLSVMFSLGVLSAGCNLIVKRGDPVRFVTMALTYYFSGRIFPVQILPASLQSVAWVLPQTWIYYLWRKSLFANASPLEILNGLLFLTVTLVVLASIAYGVFQYGINKIREEGLIE
ncbi:MAG: hypothetical protein DRJ64_06445 [Thermoprotei archaeon]|nr:MAG: hypothetical protein DRJ64_06445 [Thermoprotei archaeon]